jgi:hypothetical protein
MLAIRFGDIQAGTILVNVTFKEKDARRTGLT